MAFDSTVFCRWMLRHGVVQIAEDPLVLRSGRRSHWYVNWRQIGNDVYLCEVLVKFLIDFIDASSLKFDTIYAVPEGATPFALLAQYVWASKQPDYGVKPYTLAMGRGKPKDHGDPRNRFFIGKPAAKTIVIEDVTTTGGSLLQEVAMLLENGVDISAVVSLTHRAHGAEHDKIVEILGEHGIPFHTMCYGADILNMILSEGSAFRSEQPSSSGKKKGLKSWMEIRKEIEGERDLLVHVSSKG